MGVFAASGHARTFDFRANDVGYVPFAMGHYIENTGNTTLRFLEMFKSDLYEEPEVKDSNGEPVVNRVLTIMLADEY